MRGGVTDAGQTTTTNIEADGSWRLSFAKREAILRLPHPDTLQFDYFALRDHTTS